MAPQTPQRSERPGKPVALLVFGPTRGEGATEERHSPAGTLRAARRSYGGPPRSVTAPPGRSEPPGGLRGALRGASRLRPDAPSRPGVLGGPSEERHGSARDAPSHPEVKGALRGPLRRLEERTGDAERGHDDGL